MSDQRTSLRVGLLVAAAPILSSGVAFAQSSKAAKEASSSEVATPGSRIGFALSGYVQADAVAFRQSSQDELNPTTGEPLNEARFTIPRARLRADVSSLQGAPRSDETALFVRGALELDGNTLQGPAMRLVEAHASLGLQGPDATVPFSLGEQGMVTALPYAELTVGLFKIPFGVEGPERERSRLFLERSAVTRALVPGNYDLGARLMGGYGPVRYALAVMNGEPVGEGFFPGRDPNGAKDILGRLGIDAHPHAKLHVRAGFSGLSGKGFHRGTPSTKDTLVWRDDNEDGLVQQTEIRVIAGSSATASQNFDRFALAADLRVDGELPVLGTLSVFGEVVRAQNLDRAFLIADPIAMGRDVREQGFYVAATQDLTRWAQVGVRYDHYDPDVDASETIAAARVPRDASTSALAVTAAVRFTPSRWTFAKNHPFPALRLIGEYDRRKNALGRTPGGYPTTLADDAFAVRAEVSF